MIVIRQEPELRVITQPDHARTAAEMLSLWREDGLPEHPRRAELLFAVREHDNGWRETDAAPRVDPDTGRPYTFLDLPDGARRELWDRATRRYDTERPAAAALITRHALALHGDLRSSADWDDFLDALDERLDDQLERAALERLELEADYRWLAVADALSLRACGALGPDFDLGGTHAERRGSEVALAPFPLAGATTFAVPCRHIPDRPYENNQDLALELASARWTRFEVKLVSA